jgi:acetyl-CoA carboxylase biotin carboxyl carrier protein
VNIDLDRLAELVSLVKGARISELTIRDGDDFITIKKPLVCPPPAGAGATALAASSSAADTHEASQEPEEPADETAAAELETARYVTVKANMVGTFSLGEKPGGEPLVRVGQQVETGQVVCTIESMKLVHEVHTSASGTVVQILAEDGQPVEYGSDLMLIEAAGGSGRD